MLVEDVVKAWAAYMAKEDPVKSTKLEKRWNEAKVELNIFQRQQVAGGEGPKQAASCDLHGVRQQVCLAGGAVQGLATRSSSLLVESFFGWTLSATQREWDSPVCPHNTLGGSLPNPFFSWEGCRRSSMLC